MPSPNLFDALEDVPVVDIDHVVYRHVGRDRDCRSGEGARAHGGRWNPPKSFPTLYTSVTPFTARLELERLAARQKLELEDLLPRTLCVLDVRLHRVVDLSNDASLAIVRLDANDVAGEEAAKCQEVGDIAHQMGFEGLLVPSAAGVGVNLIVYPLNLGPDCRLDEQDVLSWTAAADLPAR